MHPNSNSDKNFHWKLPAIPMTMIITGFRLKFVAEDPACLDDSSIFKFLIESASSSLALPLSLYQIPKRLQIKKSSSS